MGMDLYNSSPAAHAVWDAADEHLLVVYGSRYRYREAQPEIHFGGIKGPAICQCYVDMTYV